MTVLYLKKVVIASTCNNDLYVSTTYLVYLFPGVNPISEGAVYKVRLILVIQ